MSPKKGSPRWGMKGVEAGEGAQTSADESLPDPNSAHHGGSLSSHICIKTKMNPITLPLSQGVGQPFEGGRPASSQPMGTKYLDKKEEGGGHKYNALFRMA